MSDSSLLTGDATTAAPAATTTTPAAGSTPAAAPVVQAQTDPATPPAGESAVPKADGAPAGSEPAAKGAPESYEAFNVPEGVVIDADLTAALASLAKELNLDQTAAQRVVDAAAQIAQAQTEAQVAAIAKVRGDWQAEVAADPEVGGERMGENLARAKASMLATTTPKMQMLLARSGLGDNVEVIRHFLKVAPAFLEDTHVPGGTAPPGTGKTAAQILYDAPQT